MTSVRNPAVAPLVGAPESSTHAAQANRSEPLGEVEPIDLETMRIARKLVRAAARAAPRFLGDSEEAVMLDLELDGVRCVLIAHGEAAPSHHSLSPREQEIVRMIARGYPNKTVAAVLDISTWTVSTHLRRIFAKLGVRTRAAMVARAIELKLVSADGRPAPPR